MRVTLSLSLSLGARSLGLLHTLTRRRLLTSSWKTLGVYAVIGHCPPEYGPSLAAGLGLTLGEFLTDQSIFFSGGRDTTRSEAVSV